MELGQRKVQRLSMPSCTKCIIRSVSRCRQGDLIVFYVAAFCLFVLQVSFVVIFVLILFLIIKYFLLMVILFSGFSRIQWILGTKLPVKKWWRSYWTMLCLALQPVSANNWIRQSWANESCHRAIGDSCFWFIKRIVWQAILNAQVGQHFTIAQNHGELHFVSGPCQSIAFVIRVIWSNQRWGTLATSWAMHPLRTNF